MGKKPEPAKPAPKPAPAPAKKEEKPKAEAADFIAKAPIRRLMKNQGANLVAEEAVMVLIGFLEKFGGDVTKKAMDMANADKRKRVTAEDIIAASKTL